MDMRILELDRIKKFNNFIKKNIFYLIYFFLLLIFLLLIIFQFTLSVYFISGLLGFGWSIFFFRNRLNILEHFFLSFVILITLFLVFCILFAFINIKLTVYVGLLFLCISVITFIIKKVFDVKNINFKIEKYDYFILFLFLCALTAKIASVITFDVPGLHDPISHAYFSKQIAETGYIRYFYSPGLHLLGAFGELYNGFGVAKQILYITNFFNAYSGVLAYLFIKHVFKKKIWALSSALLFSLGYFPSIFFVSAGKNALVLAIPFLFLCFFLIGEYRRKRNVGLLILINFTFAAIFIIHYPAAVFACTYFLAVFFADFKKERFRTLLMIVGILFGIAWMLKSYQYQLLAVSQYLVTPAKSVFFILPENILSSLMDFGKSLWSILNYNNSVISKIIATCSLLGLLLISTKSFKKSSFRILFLWFIFSSILAFLLSLFKVTSLFIVLETFNIMFFIYYYIWCGMLINEICKLIKKDIGKRVLNIFFIIFFLISTILLSIIMYRTFYNRTYRHNVIEESDIESFKWINENLSDKEKFLINANGNNGLVFSTDAGGWLEIFTDNEISTPFYDYASKKTDENIDAYYELKKDIANCEIINNFVKDGYKYYYDGSKHVFDTELGTEEFLESSGRFNTIFESGNSNVYELIPCK